MMLTGRTLSASAAKAIGLVDKVVDEATLLDAAVTLAQKGTTRPFRQRFLAWITNTWPARQLLAPQMAKQVARKAPKAHYRSEERRGGKACVSTCRSRWSPYH